MVLAEYFNICLTILNTWAPMTFKNFLILTLSSILIGILAAMSCHAFILALRFVLNQRHQAPQWIWILPMVGFVIMLSLKKLPTHYHWGVTQYLDEIWNPKRKASLFHSPWVFISTSLIHLGGGSAGREGVGLIMNGSLADGLLPFKKESEERSILLQASLSAGFAAMFGTPLAGLIFIFESQKFRDLFSWKRILLIGLSVVTSFFMGKFLNTPHTHHSPFLGTSLHGFGLMMIAVPLVAHLFYLSYHFIHVKSSLLGDFRLPLGGLIITCIVYFFGQRYSGLGEDIIFETLHTGKSLPWDFLGKLFLTTLTLGLGFKGGEVTPLFFIGATLGASLGQLSGDTELAKIGMVSVLGSLTHTPLATGILAFEIFGSKAILPSFLLAFVGRKLLGKKHLYKSH